MSLIDRTKMLFPGPPDTFCSEPRSFEKKIDDLTESFDYALGIAGGKDCPTGDFEVALAVIKQIPTLFDAIAHGGPEHREWLKQAIECHFQGLPMPEYKG